MSFMELVLVFIVALMVFGPHKLPMLASHLGKTLAWLSNQKAHLIKLIKAQQLQYLLEENQKKASLADEVYDKNKPNAVHHKE